MLRHRLAISVCSCVLFFCATNSDGRVIASPSTVLIELINEQSLDIQIWFTGNDTLSATSGPTPEVRLSQPETVTRPHGINAYWETMCTPPCIFVVNATFALFRLNKEPQLDSILEERITIDFDRSFFADRNARQIAISVVPKVHTQDIPGLGLSSFFQFLTIASSLLMPTMIDAQIVSLFTQSPCIRSEQLEWFPFAPELSFLMAGDSVFSRSWMSVAVVGALLFVGVSVIGLFPAQLHGRTMVRAVIPLVLIQAVNLWFPAYLFAGAYLTSFGIASYQVWGAFLLAGSVGLGLISLIQMFADPTVFFVQSAGIVGVSTLSVIERLIAGLLSTTGRWLMPRYCILMSMGDTWFLRHMNRILLPFYFGSGSLRNHLIFLALNAVMIACTGIQGRSPTGCFAQGCCIAGFLFLSSFGLLTLPFKSQTTKFLSVCVRVISAGQLASLVATPNGDFYVLFIVCTAVNSLLLFLRILVIGIEIYQEGIDSVCDAPTDDSLDESLVKESRRTRSIILRERREESDDAASDLQEIIDGEIDRAEEESSSSEDDNTPGWIKSANATKPKVNKNDRLEVSAPFWYPDSRPNVRTTNEADCELDLSPYTVRTTRKRLPM